MGSFEVEGVSWQLAAGCDADRLRPLLQRALELVKTGAATNLKSGRRKQLYRLALLREDKPDHLLKVNLYPERGVWPFSRRDSKARHELRVAEGIAERGLPTPVPLAAGEQRRGRRLEACYLLVPLLDDVMDLRELWFDETPPPSERRALAQALGDLSRRVHDAGVFQDDFLPNNFLVRRGPKPELMLIDFERAELRNKNSHRARRWMLTKLERAMGRASAADRMRFLFAYASGRREEAQRWWHEVAAAAPRLARRDLSRMRRNVTRAGRRYRPVAGAGWVGFARSGVQEADLERAAASLALGDVPQLAAADEPEAWVLALRGLKLRAAGELFARAVVLFARGLGPRPAGVLWRAGGCWLVLERSPKSQRLCDASPGPETSAALAALGARLRGYGEVEGSLDANAVIVEPYQNRSLRGWWARPDRVHFSRR